MGVELEMKNKSNDVANHDHGADLEVQDKEIQINTNNTNVTKKNKVLKIALTALNCSLMAVGNTVSPLLLRVYFRDGGKRVWLSAFIQTVGFPLILPLLFFSFLLRRRHSPNAKFFHLTRRLFASCVALGLGVGLVNFFYADGLSYLPVSTSTLLVSTQLVFTAFFAFLIVKQKFTAYTINSVAMLTVGAVILGLHSGSDRPPNETMKEYYMGFVLTIGASVVYGLVLPLIEFMYGKASQEITYTLVLEMQLVMGCFSTVFALTGMLIQKDFQAIPEEARNFASGVHGYYTILILCAIFFQCFFVGTVGVIFCVNTLLSGIVNALFLPVCEVCAVIFLHEKFSSEKIVALLLSLWGLASYSFGEYKMHKEKQQTKQISNN